MSEPHRRRLDAMVAEGYLDGLDAKPLDEIRAMDAVCLEVETEISYVRRLVQARIDIVSAELDRRADGWSFDLVDLLPQILADDSPRPAQQPPAAPTGPLDDTELRDTLDQLRTLEREMSERRRALHGMIGGVERELADRHRVDRV